MAVTTVEFGLPKAKKLHPLCGFGAQFNTNLFTEAGQSPLLTDDQVGALRAAIKSLKLGHSRIFVRPVARSSGVQRDALMSTIKLAHETGANVNLTWWKGPFPHEPQRDHAEKRRKLMDDFAGIIREARAICGDVVYVTIMNEVNSYDIAKALKPQKSMELYNSLYRDLHAALTEIPDPKDSSRRLRAFIRLVGGDLVERGPGKILVNKKPFDYGPSGQNDWLEFMRENMADVLNGYSIHVYWEPREFPQKPLKRLNDLAKLGIEKPIYITEYGVRRLDADPRPGTFDGTAQGTKMEQSPETAFSHAWFNALAPQYGCVGLVKWVLYKTARRDEFGEWGMIGPARGPLGPFHQWPTCEVTRLFNHLTGQRWTADGLGDAAAGRLLASRFKGPRGDQSVVVLNNTSQPQQVRLKGLKKSTRFFAAEWNRKGGGILTKLAPLTSDAQGAATTNVDVPRHGLVALSTRTLPL